MPLIPPGVVEVEAVKDIATQSAASNQDQRVGEAEGGHSGGWPDGTWGADVRQLSNASNACIRLQLPLLTVKGGFSVGSRVTTPSAAMSCNHNSWPNHPQGSTPHTLNSAGKLSSCTENSRYPKCLHFVHMLCMTRLSVQELQHP